MRIAVLSPHRDDAAFSCGLTLYAALRAGAEITVVNVFTRSDYAVDSTTIDSNLPYVEAISQARRREDEQFVADLADCAGRESDAVWLQNFNLLDAPLRLTVQTEHVLRAPLSPAEVHQQATEIGSLLLGLQDFDLVFAPLAIGDHIDHRIVREAARRSFADERLCLYEDLPYAARLAISERTAQAHQATRSHTIQDFVPCALHLPGGPQLKRRLAMHYPSQIAPEVADEMALYAEQGSSIGAGAERWWAMPATIQLAASFLHAGPCHLVEEQA